MVRQIYQQMNFDKIISYLEIKPIDRSLQLFGERGYGYYTLNTTYYDDRRSLWWGFWLDNVECDFGIRLTV